MKIWKLAIVVLALGMFSVSAVAQDTCATAQDLGADPVLDPCDDTDADFVPGSCTGAANDQGVWGTFVAGETSIRIRTDLGSVGTDSSFVVYSGTCGALTEVGCSEDDYPADPASPWLGDICVAPLTAGNTYYIQATSWPGTCGPFTFTFEEPAFGGTCGDGEISCAGNEECDGDNNSGCEESCESDCTCTPAFCGNNIKGGDEECDGTADIVCPGLCLSDCTCQPDIEGPALPPLGIVGLGVLLLGGGAVVFARKRKS